MLVHSLRCSCGLKGLGALVLLAVGVLVVLTSCGSRKKFAWTPPEFVKEWEIKEVRPGLRHYIVSMTANEHGVFVLVRVPERVYVDLGIRPKRAEQMTAKEKEAFFRRYESGCIGSASALLDTTEEERDQIINFLVDYFIPPRKAEIGDGEKAQIIEFLTVYTNRREPKQNVDARSRFLEKEGPDALISNVENCVREASTTEVEHYRVQRYDFDGSFIYEWPQGDSFSLSEDLKGKSEKITVSVYDRVRRESFEFDSRERFVKPLRIVSGDDGHIYVADYLGNKVIGFDWLGNVVDVWKIESEGKWVNAYEFLEYSRGFCVRGEELYLVSGYGDDSFGVLQFEKGGRRVRDVRLPLPDVPAIDHYHFPVEKKLFKKVPGRINDAAVNGDGNLYVLAGMIKLMKYDRELKPRGGFEPVLKEGFDMDVYVFNPKTGKEERYQPFEVSWPRDFDSQKGSGFGHQVRLYELDKVYVSPRDEVFVTFIGQKAFGVIDALVYDRDGRMLGYWKEGGKSRSEWYRAMSALDRVRSVDRSLSLAFHGGSVFIGKTIEFGEVKSFVQRFDY